MRAGPDLEVVDLEGPEPVPPEPGPPHSGRVPGPAVVAAAVLVLALGFVLGRGSAPGREGGATTAASAPAPGRTSEGGALYRCRGALTGIVRFSGLPAGVEVDVRVSPLRGPDVGLGGRIDVVEGVAVGADRYRASPAGVVALAVHGMPAPPGAPDDRLPVMATPVARGPVAAWQRAVLVTRCAEA